ncbi:HAD-IC family P-type ATPase [Bauldia sp.]|uniref:HAD-IC family P-type ATPase n=1 Tax=Bauldia sp. TaxID=2575872 RepID=UPI0025C6293D|nr:HAD-IC family P-type ATPase [Bauldia sp.]
MADGIEARLGGAAFCGIPSEAPGAGSATASHLWFRHGGSTAVFAIEQVLKPDAAAVVAALKARGYDCRILSGDREAAVAPVARQLDLPYASGMKPADKIAALRDLAAAGHRVAMVGDGLNDAPALAEAHVSLSPISALDITQAQADAVFLGERLMPVVDAFDIGRRARRLMNQNLAFTVIYNLAAVPLAIFGVVTPLIAAVAMSGSSITVTLNALRARMPEKAPPVQRPAGALPAGTEVSAP